MEDLQRLQQDMLHAALAQQTILARHQEQQVMFKSAWDKAARGEDVAHLVPSTDGQDMAPHAAAGLASLGAFDATMATGGGNSSASSTSSAAASNGSGAFPGNVTGTVPQQPQAGPMASLQRTNEQQQALLQMIMQQQQQQQLQHQQQGNFSGLGATAVNGANGSAPAATQGFANGVGLGIGVAMPALGAGASSSNGGIEGGGAAAADGNGGGNAPEALSDSDAAQAAVHQLAAHHAHAAAVACAQRGGSRDDQTCEAHAAYLAVLAAQQQQQQANTVVADAIGGGGGAWHHELGGDSGDGMLHVDASHSIGHAGNDSSNSHHRGSRKSQARSSGASKRPRDDPLPFGPTGPDGKRAKEASLPVRPSNWTPAQDRRLCDIVSVHGAREWKKIAARMKDPVPASSSSSSSSSAPGSSSSKIESQGGDKNLLSVVDDGSGDFTDVQCLHRWNKVLKPGLKKGPWTEEEDEVVAGAVATHGAHKVGAHDHGVDNWYTVGVVRTVDHFSLIVYLYSPRRLGVRLLCFFSLNCARSTKTCTPWCGVLTQVKWSQVAEQLPGRIGKQCRERWFNHLDKGIVKADW